MNELETKEEGLLDAADTSAATVPEALDDEAPEEGAEAGEEALEQGGEDWEKRCLAAEAALEDSLEFASLYAAEGGELDAETLRDSKVYQRFCELRAMGLSVKEAFSAADSARERRPSPAAKSHLLSSPSRRQTKASRLLGEELAIARQILGDEYSNEELMKLYRRVAK